MWLSDFGAHALVTFDPAAERFSAFPFPSDLAAGTAGARNSRRPRLRGDAPPIRYLALPIGARR